VVLVVDLRLMLLVVVMVVVAADRLHCLSACGSTAGW
jgi:hypothetical protein